VSTADDRKPASSDVAAARGQSGGELPGMSVEAAAQYRPALPGQYVPRAAMPSTHPRKVKGGIKLTSKSGPVSSAWSAHRWMRLVEDLAAPNAMAEGLLYARTGQTRTLAVQSGKIIATVQGRMPYAYQVQISLPTLTDEQWDKVLTSMLDEARHLAGLLGGEVPPNIEDLFSPLRLRLFPQEQPDLTVSCSCGQCGPGGTAGSGWCKHVACVMTLVAERLGADTFLIFQLRGMGREALLDELRLRRAAGPKGTQSGVAPGQSAPGTPAAGPSINRPVAAYLPRLPGVSDIACPPLEACAEHFWSAPDATSSSMAGGNSSLRDLDLTMQMPAVSHPLLRRLGPSPFDPGSGAKFPLVGLLATCYDLITEHTLRAARGEATSSTSSDSDPS
jgi:uncharacterized Zn finger protein